MSPGQCASSHEKFRPNLLAEMTNGRTAKLASFEDIQRETKGCIVNAKESWATTMYSENVPEELMKKIKAKLNITNGRFDVPKDPNMKCDLYDPLVNIIQSIIKASGNDKYKNSTREAMDTRGKCLLKEVVNSEISPDIPRIKGVEGVDASLGYTNVTSVIEVKLDHTTNNDVGLRVARKEVQMMAVHAKEIFAQQPNRLFIPPVLVRQKPNPLVDGMVYQSLPFPSKKHGSQIPSHRSHLRALAAIAPALLCPLGDLYRLGLRDGSGQLFWAGHTVPCLGYCTSLLRDTFTGTGVPVIDMEMKVGYTDINIPRE
ncbi:hypothetical protein DFP72DRAFT_839386 [Ephemerocybe angulata]|uniref:Uncharacterized protein n=1 Tax=Ephemerocybe angulata TaxID=980116 RepID=A0A8H6MGE9_9AGAR|nr:hypothetical protein DFP72DRAFT_839386 [Tulosesus angulatus]